MTTYTAIEDGQQAEISLSGSHTISDINPMIYGGFTEFVPPSPSRGLGSMIKSPNRAEQASNVPTQTHRPLHLRRSLRSHEQTWPNRC